jgi:hypothetical protein
MRDLSLEQQLAEMIGPSMSPKPPRGTLGAAGNPPVFLDVSGNPISSIVCGGSYTFDVPGATGGQIWLTMSKDGNKVYDALFPVPMPSYASSCANDVGTYVAMAYDPSTGTLLGQTTFTILPASGVSAQGVLHWLSSLSTPAKIGLGIGALLLLRRKHS